MNLIVKLFIDSESSRLRGIWRAALFWSVALLLLFASRLLPIAAREGARAPAIGGLIVIYAFQLVAALLVSSLFARWFDRRTVGSVGFVFDRLSALQIAVGLIWGVLAVASLTLLLVVLKAATVTQAPLSAANLLPEAMAGGLLFLLAGAFEEVLMRGYPFQALLQDHPPIASLFIVSLLFASFHIPNASFGWLAFINTFLAGIWLGLAYLKTNRLWLPIGLHAGWNFALGAVFGLSVSGNPQLSRSPLESTLLSPAWISGGAYGPEGGGIATVVLAICMLLMFAVKSNQLTPRKLDTAPHGKERRG